jgi:hypothetical protein
MVLNHPAVVKPQIHKTAATPSPATVSENTQTIAIIPGQLEMPVVTFRPGSGEMRLGSQQPQSREFIPVLSTGMTTDSMLTQCAKTLQPVSFYPCVYHH